MNIVKFLRLPVLKNICKRLLLSDVISTRSIWCNLAFSQPILLKILFQNENIKIYEIPSFYQEFKSENLWFLNLHSVDAARILDLSLEIMLSPSKWGRKHLFNSKGFSFMPEQVYFYFLEAKFVKAFKMWQLAVYFEIFSVMSTSVTEF